MDNRDERQIKVDNQEALIIKALGYQEAFQELSRALNYSQKEELYSYILKMNDIQSEG